MDGTSHWHKFDCWLFHDSPACLIQQCPVCHMYTQLAYPKKQIDEYSRVCMNCKNIELKPQYLGLNRIIQYVLSGGSYTCTRRQTERDITSPKWLYTIFNTRLYIPILYWEINTTWTTICFLFVCLFVLRYILFGDKFTSSSLCEHVTANFIITKKGKVVVID